MKFFVVDISLSGKLNSLLSDTRCFIWRKDEGKNLSEFIRESLQLRISFDFCAELCHSFSYKEILR